MKPVGPYISEVLFALSVLNNDANTLRVTGAHFKTNSYMVRDDESTYAHDQSTAQPLDLADLNSLGIIPGLNAAVIGELNEIKVAHNQAVEDGKSFQKQYEELAVTHNEKLGELRNMTARAADLDRELGHVTRERDESQAREQLLTDAADAAEGDRQALLETLGERSVEIQALQLEVKYLQGRIEQLASSL